MEDYRIIELRNEIEGLNRKIKFQAKYIILLMEELNELWSKNIIMEDKNGKL